jgi:hypothetical protein
MSTIVLDVGNLTIDKDQIENKYEKGLRKPPSANLVIEGEKSSVRASDF